MHVLIVLEMPATSIPSTPALSRSILICSSGKLSSREICTSAAPGVDRTNCAISFANALPVDRSNPRISTSIGADEPKFSRYRKIPPGFKNTCTPGNFANLRRTSAAISNTDRVRSSEDTRPTWIFPAWLPELPPPPMPPPLFAFVVMPTSVMRTCVSGTDERMIFSISRATESVSSYREPTGSLKDAVNLLSSWSGKNSVPINIKSPSDKTEKRTMPMIIVFRCCIVQRRHLS